MTLHKDLTGNELHGVKIPISQPNRNPAFVGETIFDGETLWVATGTTPTNWVTTKSTPAPGFSWVVDLATYANPQNFTLSEATLYYADCLASEVDQYSALFEIVKSWQFGTDLGAGCPIDITSQIQAKGKGAYTLLLSGSDGYGAGNMPAPNQRLALVTTTVSSAVESFSLTQDFTGKDGVFYFGVTGFYISNPLSQVLLQVSMVG